MIYVTLINKGEEREITVGGRSILIKKGDNWMQRGTAEFITSKIADTIMSDDSAECADDGTLIDEIRKGIEHTVTEEDIKENNLKDIVVPGEVVVIPPEEVTIPEEESPSSEVIVTTTPKEAVTEEDKESYAAELETMKREQLIDILNFKTIKFAKNATNEKLIQSILKSVK